MSQQVLSQQEIDALLVAMDSGEIDTEEMDEETSGAKVKTYDFRRPVRLSKEYLSTITMVFEDFSKLASNLLSTQLRKPVEAKIAAIEQVSFDEFVHSVPSFTLMGVFKSAPLSGLQILEINPQFSLQIVELLCGYTEVSSEETLKNKSSFTDIELAILEDVLKSLMRSFEAAWRDIKEIDVTLEDTETKPQLLQTMSPNEPVVLVTFTVSLGEQKTFLNMCIPYIFFEDILDKLSFKNWFHSGKEFDSSERGQIAHNLDRVPVDVEVVLGESKMDVSDFLEMEEGDIIQLDEKTSKPLTLYVEDKPYFKVKPGLLNKKLAVEILKFTGGESDDE
ncbi:flagellar motor switch protein FliM [Alkalibacterium pelagium]|uniref:Flagellar motor switch protein FliM n=1 Tax=Alkalibacterium pelagium TaxID=426702 RepID=A0A1H7HEA6_9LACT|nr:flagellar motor switch protein FliM [Alkalibacterium pelagium]GEN51552.1 flagellar motor switch protein FliM [Alkalibacterium pelagium]SEK46565.1 flagellar motor switch protein FliM [Alkalibacterium pelagium]